MADVKISELTALTSPDGAEELVVNDGGTTKKITIDNLFNQDIDVTGTVTADGLVVDGTAALNDNAVLAANKNLYFNSLSGTDRAYLGYYLPTHEASLWNVGNGPTVFATNNAERMRISSDGLVGIGTASPANPLHVTKEITGYQAYFNNDNGSAQGLKVRVKANDSGNFNILDLVSASTGSDVSVMTVRDDGIVTKPYQPAFLARGLSSIPASGNFFLFNSVTFDRTSSYSTSTGRFTAPVAGVYLFTFSSMGDISDDRYMCRLYLNGSIYVQSSSSSNYAQYQDGKLSIHVNLAVSDYVYMYNAGPKVPHSTSATEEWFSGHLVG